MKIRKSLIWYIVGLIVFVLVLSSLTYFYIAKLNQHNTLTSHEVSRDTDVRFIVQSLIDDEVERLTTLGLSLMQREDLIIDLADIRPGGLGVHIMTECMDSVEFAPADGGGTLLTMTKSS